LPRCGWGNSARGAEGGITTVIQGTIIDKGKSLLIMYEITKKTSIDKRWGIMKITFENKNFVHEIIPNFNNTLEHYWLVDVENHFNSSVEGVKWTPHEVIFNAALLQVRK
jgi:hypothetical protein